MNEFNNEAYRLLVSDLINDAFYLYGASYRGIIAKIRQYAEVIVRKILNLSTDQHFTTFTLPRKLMKLVYTRPELSPLDFLRFGP